jgi:hypothetical protein
MTCRANAAPQLADSTFAGGHPSFNQPSIARAILDGDAAHCFFAASNNYDAAATGPSQINSKQQ